MKHLFLTLTTIFAALIFMNSCKKDETYAEKVEAERNAISDFIAKNNIQVIDKATFEAQLADDPENPTPDNQYVLFNNTGVYMHVISLGDDGKKLAQGQGATVLSRFTEVCINTGDTTNTNTYMSYGAYYDSFVVRNYYGTFTASFKSGMMQTVYSSTSVPGGWLVPLKYIKLGHGADITKDDGTPGENAHVRIIVPHDEGTSTASSNVYAYYYDLTYQLPTGESIP